ncbi:flavodoxin family protein [Paenisporosarcina sp. TG20]|uniref:flavodoxin family protein n=1 Tax=Paenisporosarcina sp. TG20 TaxID=1211706 RepID=UPI0002E7E99E|nr:flavodoxin family protein [Paenisporosarcina sp. TG20]
MPKLKAVFLNTSLKTTDETSHTEALMEEVQAIYKEKDVESEIIRIADYKIKLGVQEDMGNGDEWPEIYDKVMSSDIVIIGTPLWLGEKSSLATQVVERLYGSSSKTNDKGQAVFYNKVGGVVVTGNEDGAKHASASILYALSHIGFVIPPNVDAYWVGEAGPGPSYIEGGKENDFTKGHVRMLAYNTIHLATMLKNTPIPAEGNTLD